MTVDAVGTLIVLATNATAPEMAKACRAIEVTIGVSAANRDRGIRGERGLIPSRCSTHTALARSMPVEP